MRFMSDGEAVKRMAEAQVMASRVREERQVRESRHVLRLVGVGRFDDDSVLL